MSSRTRTRKQPRTAHPAAAKPAPAKKPASLPVRTPAPEFITEAQMAAAWTAVQAGLPRIPIRAWTAQPDGTHRAAFPSGAHLVHTPDGPTPYRALTPCPHGAIHDAPITTGASLNAAENTAAGCTAHHYEPATTPAAIRVTDLADGIHRTEASAADTQQLNVTELRAEHDDQAKEHPEP